VPGTLGGLAGQRGRVGPDEVVANRGAALRQINQHKPPGLAQPDRGSETRELDQSVDHPVGQGIAAKPSHIATPGE
jgi:hypothetical protein